MEPPHLSSPAQHWVYLESRLSTRKRQKVGSKSSLWKLTTMSRWRFRPKKMSSLARAHVGQIAIVLDARYTAMQQAGIMDPITPLVDTVASRPSIVRIIWQSRLAPLPLNTYYHWQRPMYPLHPAYTLTTSTRTIHESWDPGSRRMQHNNVESSSSNPWNAAMVDANVNLGPALVKRTVVDVVFDALVLKTPRVIQI